MAEQVQRIADFCIGTSFHLSYTVLKGNSGNCKSNGSILESDIKFALTVTCL